MQMMISKHRYIKETFQAFFLSSTYFDQNNVILFVLLCMCELVND